MTKRDILTKTRAFVRRELEKEGTGHDWWHIERVTKAALAIGRKEKAGLFVVELAALLHDIADHKFHNGDHSVGPRVAGEWLAKIGVDAEMIEHVKYIIENVSFKGGKGRLNMKTIEGKVVQDADGLDALGALGIARTFAYGGYAKRPLFDPKVPLRKSKKGKYTTGSSIHHFYDKLLLLKDFMNTKAGKQMAAQRHTFLETYLKEFFSEWNGKA